MALVTLPEVKEHLLVDDVRNDHRLTLLMNAVSQRIVRWTGRDFVAADYNEWLTPYMGSYSPGQGQMWGPQTFALRQSPVLSINAIGSGLVNAIRVNYTGSDAWARAGVTPTGVNLAALSAANTSLAFADYPTLSAMAAAIAAETDWDASLVATTDAPSASLWPMPAQDASAAGGSMLQASDLSFYSKAWSFKAGVLTLPGPWPVYVAYRAGYETVPADVKLVALDEIAERWRHLYSNAAVMAGDLKSEQTLDWSWTRMSLDEIGRARNAVLAPYKVPR